MELHEIRIHLEISIWNSNKRFTVRSDAELVSWFALVWFVLKTGLIEIKVLNHLCR